MLTIQNTWSAKNNAIFQNLYSSCIINYWRKNTNFYQFSLTTDKNIPQKLGIKYLQWVKKLIKSIL